MNPVPEFVDPVFVKTSPKRSFSMTENKRFGLVFAKTGSINSGSGLGAFTFRLHFIHNNMIVSSFLVLKSQEMTLV